MIQLNLSERERAVLTNLLENCLTDLRDEIHHTENAEYKQMLLERKYVLTHLLEALKEWERKLAAPS